MILESVNSVEELISLRSRERKVLPASVRNHGNVQGTQFETVITTQPDLLVAIRGIVDNGRTGLNPFRASRDDSSLVENLWVSNARLTISVNELSFGRTFKCLFDVFYIVRHC